MENGNKPAFALAQNSATPKEWLEQNMFGLTKREYFAGLAMQSIFSSWHGTPESRAECAKRSINMADELLKQLES